MSYVKNFFGFRASPWGLTSGKNFMVIRPAVPEILGGVVPPPQMLLGCQKQQMLLTVNSFLVYITKQYTIQLILSILDYSI